MAWSSGMMVPETNSSSNNGLPHPSTLSLGGDKGGSSATNGKGREPEPKSVVKSGAVEGRRIMIRLVVPLCRLMSSASWWQPVTSDWQRLRDGRT
jgi:hypothetical protein